MSKLHLTGIVPPLVTPLDASGDVDQGALARHIERVIAGEVSGLFVLGTTGEGPSLSDRQRRNAIAGTCEATAGRVPVLVGISDTSLENSLELARYAQSCGASAVVAAPPYYFPMSQGDLARWFTALAQRSPLPVVLYNMPACVRTVIEPETLEVCARSSNIVAVKDSSGDLEYFRRLIELRRLRADWTFLVGPEHLLAEATQLGGDGGVSGGANLAPELFVAQYHAAKRGDAAEVAELQRGIEELGRLYRVTEGFMGVARGIKGALRVLGVCGDAMAAPFVGCTETERAAIAELVRSMEGRVPFRAELLQELARRTPSKSLEARPRAGVLS
jgi:dihydrodipicolinate synthase/N-acetylneuraminate lyase